MKLVLIRRRCLSYISKNLSTPSENVPSFALKFSFSIHAKYKPLIIMNVTEVKRATKTMVPRTNFKLRIQADLESNVDNSSK